MPEIKFYGRVMVALLTIITLQGVEYTRDELYTFGLLYHEEGDFVPSATCLRAVLPHERAPVLLALQGLRSMQWPDATLFCSPDYWWYDRDITNKKIFIKHDGGAGDAVQFLRYVKHLHDAGAYVMIETPYALKDIYARCPYIDQQVPYGTVPAHADITLTLSTPSLTYAMRNDLEKQSQEVPYIFANPELVEFWKSAIKVLPGKKVGISWCSSPAYNSNREAVMSPRCIPLVLFEEILAHTSCTFIALQCGFGVDQLHALKTHTPIVLKDLDTTHGRFMDTMAIMCNLDLMITVDTSLAHIAGALGIPVWLILPKCSDYRWFTERTDSVWYPTMRIFRQKPYESWEPVLNAVCTALKELYP